MILVDTSVWVEHLRRGDAGLRELLDVVEVATHPFVCGELSLGHLRRRNEILALLDDLPQIEVAAHEEVLALVERRDLPGSGIGWIDAHLLAAAALSGASLWTFDRRLAAVAADLGLSAE